MTKHIKLFEEWLTEADLDLDALAGDTGDKKEKPKKTPEEEADAAAKKKIDADEKKRKEKVEEEKDPIKKAFAEVSNDFKEKFKSRIEKALKADSRTGYHDLIIDIQRYQMPFARSNQQEEIEKTSVFIDILQKLNKTEFR